MRKRIAAAIFVAGIGLAGAAQAQSAVEGRVDRLEREMRAVQRKVFPGGSGQYFEPQIAPPDNQSIPGAPASSPMNDLTARVVALESQVSAITGQVEQAQYRLRQLEEAFNAYKRSGDARLKALEDTATATGSSTGMGGLVKPAAAAASAPGGAAAGAMKPAAKPATKPATTVATGASATARAVDVASIEKPDTGDAAEDAYIYGYRLWDAKLYPEAEKQLAAVVAKYPKHRRASYAQNLLGRAYLDDGKLQEAGKAFVLSYQNMPDGERAPDSLFYLAQVVRKLGKPAPEVCRVYRELDEVYGTRLSEQMKADVAAARADLKCK